MALNRKAVSPLIATVLLISFAVALGAVVMAFGSKTFEESFTKNCLNIDLKISSACYAPVSQKLKMDLLNNGKADIASFKLWIAGDSVFKTTIEEKINKGESISKEVDYNPSTYGEASSISIIPSVKKGDQTIWCIDNTASKQKLSAC